MKGLIGPHQSEQIRFFDAQIKKLDREIEERMRPFEKAVKAIHKMPGIGRWTAEEVLAETGDDAMPKRRAPCIVGWTVSRE